jgi:hypothetical protein
VAFDYYRHDVIKQLGFPIPASVKEEHGFWEKMNQLAFNYAGPWTAPGGTDPLAYVKADAGADEPDKAAPAEQPQPTAQAQLPPPAPVQDPHLHKGTRKEPHLHSRKKKNDG